MRKGLWLMLIAVFAVVTVAVPNVFEYQGKLTDPAGIGINDTLDMDVNLFDGPDAGTATLLSSDALVDVPIVHGLFDIQFDVDLDQSELMGDIWMELTVDGSAFTPLVQLTSVPFAMSAMYVDSAYHAVKADSLGNYVAADLLPNDLQGAYNLGGLIMTSGTNPVDIRTAMVGPSDDRALEVRTDDDIEPALYAYNAGAGPAIYASGDLRLAGGAKIWTNSDVIVWLDGNVDASDEEFIVQNDTGLTVFSVNEHGDAFLLGELDPVSVTFQPQAVAPIGAEGKVYYNQTAGNLKWYDGAAWQDFGSGSGPSGDFIWDQDTFAQPADFWIENEGEFGVYMAATEIEILTEDFEGTWPVATWTLTGNAWDRNDNWARTNYAGGNGFCADADADAFGGACDGHLQTPSIDLTLVSNATLEFIAAYNYMGGDSANVNISTDAGATWIPLLHWVEDHDEYGPGELVSLPLDTYIGSNVIIDFYYFADSWDWYFEVDEVRVFTIEYSTPAPKIIADGPNGNIELMDPAGDVIFDGTGLTTTGGAGVIGYDNTASGLTAGDVQAAIDEVANAAFNTRFDTINATDHDTVVVTEALEVWGELIADSIQAWGPVIYLDDDIEVDGCASFGGGVAPSITIYTEGFNGGSTPTGWAETNQTGTAALSYLTTSVNPTGISPSEGTHMVVFNSYDCSTGDQIQLEQTTSFSTVAYSNISVYFDMYHDNIYSNADSVVLHYSTDGLTWIRVQTWLRYDGTSGWATESVVLPPGADNQATLYLAFLFVGAYGNDTHIDNLIVTAPIGAAPPSVNICSGDIDADGDIEAATFTLNGITITDWPTGGGVTDDTIWSESGNPDDTIVVMSQLKVYGELIADSIQAVGPTIEMDDDVAVHGDLNAVNVVASNNVNAFTSMTLNGATITAWPGGGPTGNLDAAYDYLAPGGGRIIITDAGPIIMDGMGVPDTCLSVTGFNPAGPTAFFMNVAGGPAIETIGDIWVHGGIFSDIFVATPYIFNPLGDTVFVDSKLYAQEFVADTIEARNEYTYFKDAIWIEDSIWMDGAWHTTWGGGAGGEWEDASTYKRVIGNDNIRAYERDDVYGLYAYNAYDGGDHSAVHGFASQTASADQNIIGVWGAAEGPNSTWGEAIGVLGTANEANSYYAVGVYARLTDDNSQPVYPADFVDAALYADGNDFGYSGYFTGGKILLDDTLFASYYSYFGRNIEIEDSILFDYDAHIWYGNGSLGYGMYYSPDPSSTIEEHNFMIGGNLAVQIYDEGLVTKYIEAETLYSANVGTLVVDDDFMVFGELIADSIQAVGDVIELDDSIHVNGAASVMGNVRDYGTYYGYPLPWEEGLSLEQDHGALLPISSYSLAYADYRDDQLRGVGVHHLLGGFGSFDPTISMYAATYGGIEGIVGGTTVMGGLGVTGPAIQAAVSGVSMDPTYKAAHFIGDVRVEGKTVMTDSLIVLGDAHITGILDPTAVGFEPQATNPMPTGMRGLYVSSTDDDLYYYDGTTEVNVSSGGGGGGSLDYAYDFGGAGVGRNITADAGAVSISALGATNGALDLVGDDPVFATLYINHTGGGNGIVNDAGYWSSAANISLGTGNFHTNSGIYQSNADFVAKVDADNDADNAFIVRNSADTDVFMVEEDGDVYVTGGIHDGVGFGTAGQVLSTDGSVIGWADAPTAVVDFDTIQGTHRDTLVVMNDFKILGELIADSIQAVGDIIEMDDSVNVFGGVSLLDDSTYRTDWEPLYVITVGVDNADFTTIGDALNAVAVNAWTNVLIDVAPGTYSSTTSLVIPSGVHLRGSGMNVTTISAHVTVDGEVSRVHVIYDGVGVVINGRADECWFECGVKAGSATLAVGSEIIGCRIESFTASMILIEKGRIADCYLSITISASGLWEISDNEIANVFTITDGSYHIDGNDIGLGGIIQQAGYLYCESNLFTMIEGNAITIENGQAEIKANHFVNVGLQAIFITGGEVNILTNDFISCGLSGASAVIYAMSAGGAGFDVNILGNHIDGKGIITGTIKGIYLLGAEGCTGAIKDNIVEQYYDGVVVMGINIMPSDPLMPIDNNTIYQNQNEGLVVGLNGRFLVTNNQLYQNNTGGGTGFDLRGAAAFSITASNNIIDTYLTPPALPGAFNTNSLGIMWGGIQPGQLP